MIRGALSALARNEPLGGLISRAPVAREVVKRVVGGDTIEAALDVAGNLADRGFFVSIERAAPAVTTQEEAASVAAEYHALIDAIGAAGLAGVCEVSVFLESIGLQAGDESRARERLGDIVAHAGAGQVAVMLGMGPLADAATTVAWADELHASGHAVGVTLAAVLRRTEADCARLADRHVRLVKGSHGGDSVDAYRQPIETDKAFVRCAKSLLRGGGQPSFATHDPRLIDIIGVLGQRFDRPRQSFEYAFFMGRHEREQERLLADGERVRVYVPYGPEWFERLVGGLAEQPSTIAAALRSLLPGTP